MGFISLHAFFADDVYPHYLFTGLFKYLVKPLKQNEYKTK